MKIEHYTSWSNSFHSISVNKCLSIFTTYTTIESSITLPIHIAILTKTTFPDEKYIKIAFYDATEQISLL